MIELRHTMAWALQNKEFCWKCQPVVSIKHHEQLHCQNTVQQVRLISAIFIDNFGEYRLFFCTGLKESERRRRGKGGRITKLAWCQTTLRLLRQWILFYSFQVLFYWETENVANAIKISNSIIQQKCSCISLLSHHYHILATFGPF